MKNVMIISMGISFGEQKIYMFCDQSVTLQHVCQGSVYFM